MTHSQADPTEQSRIIADLYENGDEYDFYQALKLLERVNIGESNNITIRPELSFDYASSDIANVEKDGDNGLCLYTTFMGLYGISSPLPAYYTEELLDDEWEGNDAPREFLDVIHQHIYPLLYKAWQKYRFAHQTVERGQSEYWDVLYSLIGIADPAFRSSAKYAQRFLPYLGILSQRQKSILGLKTILCDILQSDAVEILPCVFREVAIPESQFVKLGFSQTTLGEDVTLGQYIDDRMGKIAIKIHEVSSTAFQQYLNDPEKLGFLLTLIRFYLTQALDIEIILVLQQGAVQTTEIGAPMWSHLGRDTWLQSENYDIEYESSGLHRPVEVTLY